MKFAHMADCHIGGWRESKLTEFSLKSFLKACDKCIEAKVDFIIIAGDLFNSPLPTIDQLKSVVKKIKKLNDSEIKIYLVPGSHDFSSSGKTILDVLENAGLIINVSKGIFDNERYKLKFIIDEKTGAKITGIGGRKGTLEKEFFEKLIKSNLEQEKGFKIFIFHTAVDELKGNEFENVDSTPLKTLPKNFNYYAGGHIHYIFEKKIENYGIIAYPGPLVPNNFKEIEDLERGGFYIYDNGKISYEPIQIYNVFKIKIDCNDKTPEQIQHEINEKIDKKEFINTIVTIRLFGTLKLGKTSDIKFKQIFKKLKEKGVHVILKNISALISPELEEIKTTKKTVKEVEENLITSHLGQIKIEDMNIETEEDLTKELIKILDVEKEEGEKVIDFERRLKSELNSLLSKKLD